jgi:hypothetical protein
MSQQRPESKGFYFNSKISYNLQILCSYVDFCISLQLDLAGDTARKIDPMTSNFQAIRGWTSLFPSGSNGRFAVFCPGISH